MEVQKPLKVEKGQVCREEKADRKIGKYKKRLEWDNSLEKIVKIFLVGDFPGTRFPIQEAEWFC